LSIKITCLPNLLIVLLVLTTFVLASCGETPASNITDRTASTTATATTISSPTLALIPAQTPKPAPLILLDPGHGGEDWGGVHINDQNKIDLFEKDITLQLSQQTASLLRNQGFRVVLTRNGDNLANFPAKDLNSDGAIDQYDDIQARIELANQSNADIFLSIHINSSELGNEVEGIETYYCEERPFARQNQLLAQLIQKESIEGLRRAGYNPQNRGVKDDEVNGKHIAQIGPPNQQRKSAINMPGVLTEALFITNDVEARLLTDERIIKALSESYSRAIIQYFHAYPN
jgi:N-acetylmuramoyl-L-alanine amidase